MSYPLAVGHYPCNLEIRGDTRHDREEVREGDKKRKKRIGKYRRKTRE